MKCERGSFSIATSGNITVIFNDPTLQADEIEFSIASSGTSEAICHVSDCFMTPTQQCARSTYYDASGGRTTQVNNKCATHIARVSGTLTEVITATKVSLATVGEFTINATAFNSAYTVYFRARQY